MHNRGLMKKTIAISTLLIFSNNHAMDDKKAKEEVRTPIPWHILQTIHKDDVPLAHAICTTISDLYPKFPFDFIGDILADEITIQKKHPATQNITLQPCTRCSIEVFCACIPLVHQHYLFKQELGKKYPTLASNALNNDDKKLFQTLFDSIVADAAIEKISTIAQKFFTNKKACMYISNPVFFQEGYCQLLASYHALTLLPDIDPEDGRRINKQLLHQKIDSEEKSPAVCVIPKNNK